MKTTTVSKEKEKMNAKSVQQKQAELAAEIQKENDAKILKFAEAYRKICDEHGCGMVPQIVFRAGQEPQYAIVPVIATK